MANIKSALKRIDITKKQTLKNKSRKSEIKTYIKKFDLASAKSFNAFSLNSFNFLFNKSLSTFQV